MKKLEEMVKAAEFDPYASAKDQLLSLRLEALPDSPHGREDELASLAFVTYAVNLRTAIRDVLFFWTPERVEKEALRRAADNPNPSIIAEEHRVFSQVYQAWLDIQIEWLVWRPDAPRGEYARRLSDQIWDLLLALERRAAAAEARAMDYRLRYEFDKLRSVIAHDQLVSVIGAMIREAHRSAAEDIKLIVGRHQPALDRLARDIETVRLDVTFIADRVTDQIARECQMPPSKVREIILALAVNIASAPFGDALTQIGHRITGP